MDEPKTISELIISGSTTKLDALRKVRFLRDFFNYIFFNDVGKKEVAVKNFLTHQQQEISHLSTQKVEEFDHGKSFLLSLDPELITAVTAKNYRSVMDKIEKDIKETKSVIFYIPFEIPEKELSELGNYVKKEINPNYLVEVSYKESLIGGCSISFNGQIKDYSLKHKVDENRGLIIKSLSGYKS